MRDYFKCSVCNRNFYVDDRVINGRRKPCCKYCKVEIDDKRKFANQVNLEKVRGYAIQA